MSSPVAQKGVIEWFIRNPVAANLLMLLIVIMGFVSAFTIRTQAMPDQQLDQVIIEVMYPGSSPSEIETTVVTKMEDALRGVQGISEMQARIREGNARLTLDVSSDFDVQDILDEAKLAVDRVSGFPPNMEKPRIYKAQIESMVMFVQVSGELDATAMKAFASQVRDEILELPNVTSASLTSNVPFEISIELSQAQLRLYDLTLDEVTRAIRTSSIDLPAGSLRTEAGNILLRSETQAYRQYDFEQVPLRVQADGTRLLLGDIAVIKDGFVESNFYQLFDNKRSLGIQVNAVGNQNALDISETVNAYVEAKAASLPADVSIDAWLDASYYLDSVVAMMLDNLWYGVLLVFVVLGLFLRMQLAFWVIVGLPVCFLGALTLMPLADISVNVLSLFGFILVLGIVVDDAIIIGESAQTEVEKTGTSVDSVSRGVHRVAMPATFGVLTTITAFVPMLLMEGPAAATAAAIGGVVILCLVFSLIESKFILPSHLAAMTPLPPRGPGNDIIRRGQDAFADWFKGFVERRYKPLLITAIEHRYTTVALFVALLMIAFGIIASPLMRVVLFPALPHDYMRARVEVVDGASESQTVKITREVAAAVRAINEEMPENQRFIKHMAEFSFGSSGRIFVEIDKTNSREVNAIDLAAQWRERVGTIAGTKSLQTNGSIAQGSGTTFNFRLLGKNPEHLNKAALALQEELQRFEGIYDIESTSNSSAQEINLQLRPGAELLGLTQDSLAQQVRAAFYGIEAQRMQRDGEEVKVMVRYPRDERASIGSLETMYIRSPDGANIPFQAIADMDVRAANSTIVRTNGKRAVVITANADTDLVEPTLVVETIQQDFVARLATEFPDVTLELGGTSADEQMFLRKLLFMVGVTLFAIYALMAIPLKSYLQPLIIMAVIPFGMIGAIIGHMVLGLSFSFLSVFGVVALSGVVVNDSLIMVDFVNRGVDDGMDLETAATQAGTQRIRAILLTSLTTFFGLLPMLLETSLTAQMVLPMAVSLGFGILFATVITLFLIPCLYVILVDVDRSRNVFSTHTYESVLAHERQAGTDRSRS
jgi:multidrug efflux pump subunit AcrB